LISSKAETPKYKDIDIKDKRIEDKSIASCANAKDHKDWKKYANWIQTKPYDFEISSKRISSLESR
jgi:hypothetical protein